MSTCDQSLTEKVGSAFEITLELATPFSDWTMESDSPVVVVDGSKWGELPPQINSEGDHIMDACRPQIFMLRAVSPGTCTLTAKAYIGDPNVSVQPYDTRTFMVTVTS